MARSKERDKSSGFKTSKQKRAAKRDKLPEREIRVTPSLLVYSSAAEGWSPLVKGLASPPGLQAPGRLRLLTYNVWGSATGYESEREASLVHLVQAGQYDVVALQEMTPALELALAADPALQQTFARTRLGDFCAASGDPSEGCMLLVRSALVGEGSRVEVVKMGGSRRKEGKALLMLKLHQNGKEKLRIATSHYSSLPENAAVRAAQYEQTLAILTAADVNGASSDAQILLADFNNSSHEELAPFSSSLIDTYTPTPDLFLDNPTFGELYPLVEGSPKPRKKRRIDRILVGGSLVVVQAGRRGTERIGREALEGIEATYPSDHAGVVSTVELAAPRA